MKKTLNPSKLRRFVDTRERTRQQRITMFLTKNDLLKRFKLPFMGLFAFVTVSVTGGYSTEARADLRVCNKTSTMVGVAVGYRLKEGWMTEGWWRIPANICTSVIEGDLGSRYFYINAEDAETGGQWKGPVFMCTSNKEFKIKGLEDCFARGFERTGFFEVDTGNQKNWQVQLTDANQTKKDEKSQ